MGADLLRVRGREVEDRSSVRITKRDCERELVRELPGTRHKPKLWRRTRWDTNRDAIGSCWKVVDFKHTFRIGNDAGRLAATAR